MIYCDHKKYETNLALEIVDKIEHDYEVKCLFGAVCGTHVYGFDNKASDLDFFMVIDRQAASKTAFSFFMKEKVIDVVCMDYQYLLEDADRYFNKITSFPSIFERKTKNGKIPSSNYLREDYTSQILFESMYSDYIWDSGFLAENIEEILDKISYIGVFDYYYTRAYGNLMNNLNKENVHTARYLTAFMGIGCMNFISSHFKIPYMDFNYMMEQYLPAQLKEFLNSANLRQKNLKTDSINHSSSYHIQNINTTDYFSVSKTQMDAAASLVEKPIALIERNSEFNEWLKLELGRLNQILYKYSRQMNHIKFSLDEKTVLYQNIYKQDCKMNN